MAKKAKKKNKTKGTVLTIILTALITTIGMYVYNTYTKIRKRSATVAPTSVPSVEPAAP